MTQIKVHATGMAAAITLTLLNVVCLLLLLIAPAFTFGLFGSIMHGIDLTKIAITTTLSANTLVGFIVTLAGGYVLGIVFALIYNKLE